MRSRFPASFEQARRSRRLPQENIPNASSSHKPSRNRRDPGRKNSRRSPGSELLRSIAVFGDKSESSRRGREKAAKAREEKEAGLQATVADTFPPSDIVAAAGSTAALLPDPDIRKADVLVSNEHTAEGWQARRKPDGVGVEASRETGAGTATTSGSASKIARAPGLSTPADDGLTLPWDLEGEEEEEGVPEPAGAAPSAGGPAKASRSRSGSAGRRRRKKPVLPLGRAEAVESIHRAVTHFRASQISDSKPGSGPPDRGDSGVEPGGKDVGTVAAEEFAEIARRCLGSGLPEIALEVRGSSTTTPHTVPALVSPTLRALQGHGIALAVDERLDTCR